MSLQDIFGDIDINKFWIVASEAESQTKRSVLQVLNIRFEADGSVWHTYKEIAELWNISISRAQTLVDQALRKMNHPMYFKQFTNEECPTCGQPAHHSFSPYCRKHFGDDRFGNT